MKKLIPLLFLLFLASACSVDERSDGSESVILPIESVVLPQATTFAVNQKYEVIVRYKRPSTCYIFNGFYSSGDGLTTEIAIACWKLDEDNCMIDESTFEIPMEFKPTIAGDHVLKFLNGEDGGSKTYIEYTLHVE